MKQSSGVTTTMPRRIHANLSHTEAVYLTATTSSPGPCVRRNAKPHHKVQTLLFNFHLCHLSGMCVAFIDALIFLSAPTYSSTHLPPVIPFRCFLTPQRGPCGGQYTKYYYSRNDGACLPFTFSGCGGNDNNFDTKQNCEDICLGKSSDLFVRKHVCTE